MQTQSFQNGTCRQVDAMHRELVELVAHAGAGSGQKARPHLLGHLTQAQIDAGGLDLIVADRLRRQDLAPERHRFAQHLRRQQTGRGFFLTGASRPSGERNSASC